MSRKNSKIPITFGPSDRLDQLFRLYRQIKDPGIPEEMRVDLRAKYDQLVHEAAMDPCHATGSE